MRKTAKVIATFQTGHGTVGELTVEFFYVVVDVFPTGTHADAFLYSPTVAFFNVVAHSSNLVQLFSIAKSTCHRFNSDKTGFSRFGHFDGSTASVENKKTFKASMP
jgi:hypothetical protein